MLEGTGRFLLETLEEVTESLTGTALLVAAVEGTGAHVEWHASELRARLERLWSRAGAASQAPT